MQGQRNYGIDLLRMLSMFMVIILHVLGHSGVLSAELVFETNYEVGWLMETAAYCAVNCYALISGFVGFNSKFKISNIIYLWFQVIFYTILITLAFAVFKPSAVGFKNIIAAFLPVSFNQYWYFTAYFGMFFFIPVFNYIVSNFSKKSSLYFVTALTVIFSIIPTLMYKDVFVLSGGYSPFWLAIMYIFGAYIKKYNLNERFTFGKSLILFSVCVIASWGMRLVLEYLTVRFMGEANYGSYFISYVSPTIILSAAALLVCFANMQFKSRWAVKAISLLSPLAFSVYLIHYNPLVVSNILHGAVENYVYYSAVRMFFAVPATAIVIYLLCSAIDFIRLKIFKLLHVRELSIKIEGAIKKLFRFNEKISSEL